MGDPGDEKRFFEIVNGERRPIPPPGVLAARTGSRLAFAVGNFVERRRLGEATAHLLFRLRAAGDRCRMPDVAFVSFERWPEGRPMPARDDWWDVIPDLAAEVVTAGERVDALMNKVADYFTAGVRLVWVLYPWIRLVHVYESLTDVRVLTAADELDGGAVLTGFRLPVASLFPEAAPPARGAAR